MQPSTRNSSNTQEIFRPSSQFSTLAVEVLQRTLIKKLVLNFEPEVSLNFHPKAISLHWHPHALSRPRLKIRISGEITWYSFLFAFSITPQTDLPKIIPGAADVVLS